MTQLTPTEMQRQLKLDHDIIERKHNFKFELGDIQGYANIGVTPADKTIEIHDFFPYGTGTILRDDRYKLRKGFGTLCHIKVLLKLKEQIPNIHEHTLKVEHPSDEFKGMLKAMGLRHAMPFNEHLAIAIAYANKKGFDFKHP